MTLRFRQLQAFHAIVETGTVTGAAVLLGISQPGISNLLAQLEHQTRFKLFERVRGRLITTPEANMLYHEIDTVVQLAGSICDAIITQSPGEVTFPIMHDLCQPGLAVSELDCLKAMAQAFLRLKIVVEPGAAVGLAAALYHSDKLPAGDLIVVASGGNVDGEMFARALATLD